MRSKQNMVTGLRRALFAWTASLAILGVPLRAQSPRQIVEQAVQTELAANRNDHTLWRFLQREKLPADTVSIVVQSAQGSVSRKIEQNGRPLSSAEAAAESKRVADFLHNTGLQQKRRRDAAHDEASAAKLLKMLPTAFTWTVASETPDAVTLRFQPNSAFQPPDMESRVMSAMAGELIVDRDQHRIRTMRGALSHEVDIGFGLFGKLRQGGTFDVERREIVPGLWQIVETHVHIDGRALLFKTIGQQQDEIDSGFVRVPDGATFDHAAALLAAPPATAAATRAN